MRYLSRSFAIGAVRRGAVVGQLLGGYDRGPRHGLRVLTVQPDDGGTYSLFVHEIEDTGGEELAELPPWGSEDAEAAVSAETPDALLSFAEQRLAADPERWVNESMLDDEYVDHVRAGRPATLDPPG